MLGGRAGVGRPRMAEGGRQVDAWLGLAGWFVVAMLMYAMRRLAEPGTRRLASCVGRAGTVYLNIPAGGQGDRRLDGALPQVVAERRKGGPAVAVHRPGEAELRRSFEEELHVSARCTSVRPRFAGASPA